MFKHEHFEELCATASVGQASPEELLELEQHTAQCDDCRKAYWGYLNLAGRQLAEGGEAAALSAQEAQDCLDSDLMTRRFLERAEREGINFSRDVEREVKRIAPQTRVFAGQPIWRKRAMGIAAAAVITATVTSAFFYAKRSLETRSHANQSGVNAIAKVTMPGVAPSDPRMDKLAELNSRLETKIDDLKHELRRAKEQLEASYAELRVASKNGETLESKRDELEAKVSRLQQDLADSEAALTSAQRESARLRDNSNNLENSLVASGVKIQELTDELREKSAALDKEKQLLAVGHDVTDLMGARNLHIVDVVDTDSRGKTRPAFGRIFFTEGKSLIFYAYDLNDAKLQKADYQYRVWAQKEGQDKQVRSLGIFYSDDKSQRRWTFKSEDAKILKEIDSVFVTLEPEKGDPSHPHGPNLMYAYLRGQPNHP